MDNLTLLTENVGQNSSTRLLTEPRLAPSFLNLKSDLSISPSNVVTVLNKDIIGKYVTHQPFEARTNQGVGEPYWLELKTKNWCRADQIKVSVKTQLLGRVAIGNEMPFAASGPLIKDFNLDRMDMRSFAQPAYVIGDGLKARVYVSGAQVSPEHFMYNTDLRTAYIQSLPLSDIHKRQLGPLGLPYQTHLPNTFPQLQTPDRNFYTSMFTYDEVAEIAYKEFWGKFAPIYIDGETFSTEAIVQIPLWFFSPFFFDKTLLPPGTTIQIQMFTDNYAVYLSNQENIIVKNNIQNISTGYYEPFFLSYQQYIFSEPRMSELNRLASTKPLIYHGLFFRCYHTYKKDPNLVEAVQKKDFHFQLQGGPLPSQIWILGPRTNKLTYSCAQSEIDYPGPGNFRFFNERVEINNHVLVNNEFAYPAWDQLNFVQNQERDFFGQNAGSTVGTIPSIKLVPNAPFQPTDLEVIDMRIKGDTGLAYMNPLRETIGAQYEIWGCTPIYWSMSIEGGLKQEYTASPLHFGSVYFK